QTESQESKGNPTASCDGMKDGKIRNKKAIPVIDIWKLRRRSKKQKNIILQNTLIQEMDNEDSQGYSYSSDDSAFEIPVDDTADTDSPVLDSPTMLTSEYSSYDSNYPSEVSPKSTLRIPHNKSSESFPEPLHIALKRKLGPLRESRRFSLELHTQKDLLSTSIGNYERRGSLNVNSKNSITRNRNNSEPSNDKSLTAEEFFRYFTTRISESTKENEEVKKISMLRRASCKVERQRSDSISSIQSLEEGLNEIFDPEMRSSRESLRNHTNVVSSKSNKSEDELFQEGKARNKEVIKDLEEKYTTVTGEICSEECEDPETIKESTDTDCTGTK
ncbi:unnamed protein product, partial [Meganyctiphanes norvegica]